MGDGTNGVPIKKETHLGLNKKKIIIETFKTTMQWVFFSVFLPLLPAAFVWLISCCFAHIIKWEPFKLYEDCVLIAYGIGISASGVLDSKIEVGTRRGHKRMESISRVMSVFLFFVYIIVYGRGLSNPTIAMIISKQDNIVYTLFAITGIIVVLQSVLVFWVEYIYLMEEGASHEN